MVPAFAGRLMLVLNPNRVLRLQALVHIMDIEQETAARPCQQAVQKFLLGHILVGDLRIINIVLRKTGMPRVFAIQRESVWNP